MLWLKALHMIFMVTWFAGLFYLPRLFVYHALADDETSNARFKIMERKLFYGIMTPGALMTVLFGVWMLMAGDWAVYGTALWLQLKLALVAGLVVYHLWCGKILIAFKQDQNRHSHVWYRWFNEIPVVALVAIILLATLRPA